MHGSFHGTEDYEISAQCMNRTNSVALLRTGQVKGRTVSMVTTKG